MLLCCHLSLWVMWNGYSWEWWQRGAESSSPEGKKSCRGWSSFLQTPWQPSSSGGYKLTSAGPFLPAMAKSHRKATNNDAPRVYCGGRLVAAKYLCLQETGKAVSETSPRQAHGLASTKWGSHSSVLCPVNKWFFLLPHPTEHRPGTTSNRAFHGVGTGLTSQHSSRIS